MSSIKVEPNENIDLLERGFQKVHSRGRPEEIALFLRIAAITGDDGSFLARLRYSGKLPNESLMQKNIQRDNELSRKSTEELLMDIVKFLTSPEYKQLFQRMLLCDFTK